MSDTSKTANIIKRWYYSTAHWQLDDVMVSDINFLWFLLFTMCHSLHVPVNKCINWCFVHLYYLFAVQWTYRTALKRRFWMNCFVHHSSLMLFFSNILEQSQNLSIFSLAMLVSVVCLWDLKTLDARVTWCISYVFCESELSFKSFQI